MTGREKEQDFDEILWCQFLSLLSSSHLKISPELTRKDKHSVSDLFRDFNDTTIQPSMKSFLATRSLLRAGAIPRITPYTLRSTQNRAMASAPSGGQQQGTPAQQTATQGTAQSSEASSDKQPLPLPEPGQEGGDGKTIRLDVGGEGVRLDHMGPLVVNTDGTMSRISNWAEMSEIERDNTLRILGKRNQQRLKKLREAKEAAEGAQ